MLIGILATIVQVLQNSTINQDIQLLIPIIVKTHLLHPIQMEIGIQKSKSIINIRNTIMIHLFKLTNHSGVQEVQPHIGIMEMVVVLKRWMHGVILNSGQMEKKISIRKQDNHGFNQIMQMILHQQAIHQDLVLFKNQNKESHLLILMHVQVERHHSGVMEMDHLMKRWMLGNMLKIGALVLMILIERQLARFICILEIGMILHLLAIHLASVFLK